jgi:hypothetical protein
VIYFLTRFFNFMTNFTTGRKFFIPSTVFSQRTKRCFLKGVCFLNGGPLFSGANRSLLIFASFHPPFFFSIRQTTMNVLQPCIFVRRASAGTIVPAHVVSEGQAALRGHCVLGAVRAHLLLSSANSCSNCIIPLDVNKVLSVFQVGQATLRAGP